MTDATILVVDDERSSCELLEAMLRVDGYRVLLAESAREALEILAHTLPDLLLVDVRMPELDGVELCRRLKANEGTRLVPLVLVTGLCSTTDRLRGIDAGADDFLAKPIPLQELRARVRSLVRLKRYTDQLDNAESVLYSLARGVEAKDPALEGHCERLAHFAVALGRAVGLSPGALEALRRGGFLHDVGKIGIPDAILFKRDPLTHEEWAVIRDHPCIGERICQPLRSMQDVLPIIRHHHERWNGSGYPDGLAGVRIPLTARILQVGDVFDALTTTRPYRDALTPAEGIKVLEQEVDRGFWDGELVMRFASLWAAGGLGPLLGRPKEILPLLRPAGVEWARNAPAPLRSPMASGRGA